MLSRVCWLVPGELARDTVSWKKIVDLNLYVQTIWVSSSAQIYAVLEKPQCNRKKQNSPTTTRTEDSTSVRA